MAHQTPSVMEIVWEDPPVPEGPFFTRDLYDKYSLAPNIRELWAFLQSPTENADMKQEHEAEALKAVRLHSTDGATEYKDKGCISKEESCWDSYDSDDPHTDSAAERTEDFKDNKKSKVKQKRVKNEPDIAYPEPRIPFPCISSLTSRDQKTYLDVLMSKNRRDPPQNLKARVNNEVMQFMRYLQDVSKICADDYNVLSHGAAQYSEEFFQGCLEYIKTLPQIYQIYEMTSLTGGTFNPGLTLTFEKQLLMMGNVDITDHTIVPADAQLASDYQSVSSETPPAKKAKDKHATVSCDGNAEKLCSHYQPHICLTQSALLRLLDNHGPEFGDQWELPVWVKLNPGKGSSHKKTVYVDSPLLKTEVTIRERSHIYHEESFKLSVKKTGNKNVFHLMTELPLAQQQLAPESSQRNVDSDGLDFAVDLTDLETFGETKATKSSMKLKNVQVSCAKDKVIPSPPKCETLSRNVALINTNSSLQETMNTLVTGVADPITNSRTRPAVSKIDIPKNSQLKDESCQESEEDTTLTGESDDDKLVIDDEKSPAKALSPQSKPDSPQRSVDPTVPTTSEMVSASPAVSETGIPKNDQVRDISFQESEEDTTFTGESDDDKLVIDDKKSPAKTPSAQSKPETPQCSVDTPVSPKPPSSQKGTSQRRRSKRAKVSGDQLGEILRMQTAMLNPAKDAAKCTIKSQETGSQSPCARPAGHSHPTSLVKPCVSSYLESNQSCAVPPNGPAPAVSIRAKEQKRILSQDLQAGTEDEQDYEAPNEGNLFYKLYSLEDLLLMVRSSVSLTHTRRTGTSQNQYVPVHVLPKLDYQLTYGVECISSSEACQLWTETLLHSSTVSYIAHINAHTSKVALLRKLPDEWKQNISCGFKPAKSLNILHHLLKKLTKLDEGRYLIGHKAGEPFVTILKAVNGKGNRGEYSLQQVHSSLPQPPTSNLVPWLPVDPGVVLAFHQKHGRVPCTFPPRCFIKTAKGGSSQHNDHGTQQAKTNVNADGTVQKRKKKAKRKAHRNKFIKKLIKESI